MAIAEMSKLRLVGMEYERQKLLNALTDTGAAQIKCSEQQLLAVGEDVSVAEMDDKAQRVAQAIEFVDQCAHLRNPDYKSDGGISDVVFDDFIAVETKAAEVSDILKTVETLKAEIAQNAVLRAKYNMQLNQTRQYKDVDVPFCDVKNTKKAKFFLGVLSSEATTRMEFFVKDECPLCVMERGNATDNGFAVLVACHSSVNEEVAAKLNELNFVSCSLNFDVNATQKINELTQLLGDLDKSDEELSDKAAAYADKLPLLRLFADRIAFEKQKQLYSLNFEKTAYTFALDAFVPTDAQEAVERKIGETTDAVFFSFEKPSEEEEVPTLMRNNKVVRQFESITNTYSAPAAREYDPNTMVAVFFSIFFGFIMADMGYGILLMLGCFLFAKKIKRDTGTRRLVYVMGIGGIFTFIFGFLFGSLFGLNASQAGFEWLPKAVIPDPVANSQEVLVYSLLGGAVHLMFGYIAKGLSCIKQKRVWDGILDGFVWAVFFVGMILLFPLMAKMFFETSIFGMKEVPQALTYAGAGVCGLSLVIEIFLAGRHSKGFGKVVGGFLAVYGLINFFSDLLSYARLYGLMLSGAMIANIVSVQSINLMHTGVVGTVGAVIILIVGHLFNLAMGVLGAYVHDCRLQYIEFFGKFYEGNGELFAPLGSNLTYTSLVTNSSSAK